MDVAITKRLFYDVKPSSLLLRPLLQELYQKALAVKSAIPHPRILGIIRECGGKMHMHDQVWSEAATDFFEVSLSAARQALHSLDFEVCGLGSA